VKKIDKTEVVSLMAKLKEKYRNEELACMLDRTTQSIWAWSSNSTKRVPCKSDYLVLKRLLNGKEEA